MKSQLARWSLLTVAVLGAVTLIVIQPTAAQDFFDDDCIDEETITVSVVNPFTGAVTTIERTERNYNQDCSVLRDGRENINDRAATVAVWCTARGVEVYDLDISGNGTLAFTSTFAEINAVPRFPATNTLIEGIPGIALYRLTSGELQVNGPVDWEGKPYVYIWDGC